MFRNRRKQTSNPNKSIVVDVKRRAMRETEETIRKKGVLVDLSNVMSKALRINSSKKNTEKKAKLKDKALRFILPQKSLTASTKVLEDSGEMEVQDEEESTTDFDFDATVSQRSIMVPEYACDIFIYHKHREKLFIITDYASRQLKFGKLERAQLTDWLVVMQETFKLSHETMYTTLKIMDHFFDKSKIQIQKHHLHLISSTALYIAGKFEEQFPPGRDELVYVANNAFTGKHILIMEKRILPTINYDVGYPLAYSFLRRYAQVIHLDMPSLTLARYYLETCSLYYEFVGVADSLMASACLLLTLRVKKILDWNPILTKYTTYRLSEVEPLMWAINHAMIMRPKVYRELKAAYKKYSSQVFYEVAKIPFLTDRLKLTDPVDVPVGYGFRKQ